MQINSTIDLKKIEIIKQFGKPDILRICVDGKTYEASERTQQLSLKLLEEKLASLTSS